MKRLINLSFIPGSADCGLLLLRIWLGLSIFLIHGISKVQNYEATLGYFKSLGIPAILGPAAIVAESLCAVLLVIGLATRLSALFLAVTMAVGFIAKHHMILQQGNPNSGELAFIYLAGFLALFLAGAGRFSLDAKLLK
jgi:putative oxidoreductase